ncbi:MAG: hypothetical protein LQ347_002418 [Umbilicaria vellea]|nr:MAG: hypothetical protein LQ347_002418 [Umbilicaria vellea]
MGVETLPQAEKQKRTARPNYNHIHALPLPLKTYPLPLLIPHNPFSLLHVVYTYVTQLLAPPISHPSTLFQAYFSPETRSVHVVDEDTIRVLWERGFFGKGSLSRSEPSWLDREKRRKGLLVGETSEDVTKRRREERREFKKERARKEREAIEEKLLQENTVAVSSHTSQVLDGTGEVLETDRVDDTRNTANTLADDCNGSPAGPESHSPALPGRNIVLMDSKKQLGASQVDQTRSRITPEVMKAAMEPLVALASVTGPSGEQISNQEHLQLSLEEAFFLAYGLGVLQIRDQSNLKAITTPSLFSLFRQHSYFPPISMDSLQPDDPFLASYVVYHHFRSLGWVVRPGVKFAVDYLLYNRGPVFSHAEFAVVIVPSYSAPYWTATPERRSESRKKESKSWWWLHCLNRVQSQVRKSLVLVYVEIPAPSSVDSSVKTELTDTACLPETTDISQWLKGYKVREIALKRWIPNRSRD